MFRKNSCLIYVIFCLITACSCKSQHKKSEAQTKAIILKNFGNIDGKVFGFIKFKDDKNKTFHQLVECPSKNTYDQLKSQIALAKNYSEVYYSIYDPQNTCKALIANVDALRNSQETALFAYLDESEFILLKNEMKNWFEHATGLMKNILNQTRGFFKDTNSDLTTSDPNEILYNYIDENAEDFDVGLTQYYLLKDFLLEKILLIKKRAPYEALQELTLIDKFAARVMLYYYCIDLFSTWKVKCVGGANALVKMIDKTTPIKSVDDIRPILIFSEEVKKMIERGDAGAYLLELQRKSKLVQIETTTSNEEFNVTNFSYDYSSQNGLKLFAHLFQDTLGSRHILSLQYLSKSMDENLRMKYDDFYSQYSSALLQINGRFLDRTLVEDPEPATDRPYHFYVPAYLAQELKKSAGLSEKQAAALAFLFNTVYEFLYEYQDIDLYVTELMKSPSHFVDMIKKSVVQRNPILILQSILAFPSGEQSEELKKLKEALNSEDLEDLYYGFVGAKMGASANIDDLRKNKHSFAKFREEFLRDPKAFFETFE